MDRLPESIEPDHSEEVSDEVVDLEEYARKGEKPPNAKGYRVKINGDMYIFDDPTPTGREVLTKANLLPPENYTLRIKLAGEKPRKVGLEENVDLRQPGVEKFKALPNDQTEG